MAAGAEHSEPLKVKYHLLQQLSQPRRRRLPFQKTRSPVLSDIFLKVQFFENRIEKISNLQTKIKTTRLIYFRLVMNNAEGCHGFQFYCWKIKVLHDKLKSK